MKASELEIGECNDYPQYSDVNPKRQKEETDESAGRHFSNRAQLLAKENIYCQNHL